MRVSTAFNRLLGIRGVGVSGVRSSGRGWWSRCVGGRVGWFVHAAAASVAAATTVVGAAGVTWIWVRRGACWSVSCAASAAPAAIGS